MMQRFVIESPFTDPYRNLALEEWLLAHTGPEDVILYLWQNQRTVVIGKNQNAWKECHITALEADGGHLARRLSGGGAVYHDLGNLNFTFLAQKPHYDVSRQMDVILTALGLLGIAAEKSGRNDILVDGRKVSGNAFYEHAGRCYHHGTLLMQTDGAQMARYLNVSPDKLKSKGVASVRARVTNLVDVCPKLDARMLKRALCEAFDRIYGGRACTRSVADVDQAEWQALEARYRSWEWNYGRRFAFDRSFSQRFSWGGVEIQFAIADGRVKDAEVYADALLPAFIDALAPALIGVRYEAAALAEAVRGLPCKTGAVRDELADWLEGCDL